MTLTPNFRANPSWLKPSFRLNSFIDPLFMISYDSSSVIYCQADSSLYQECFPQNLPGGFRARLRIRWENTRAEERTLSDMRQDEVYDGIHSPLTLRLPTANEQR